MAGSFLVRERRERPASCAGGEVDGLGRGARLGGLDEVVSEFAERRLAVLGVPLLEDRADAAGQNHAAGPAQRRGTRLPNQRGGESGKALRNGVLLDDNALRRLPPQP